MSGHFKDKLNPLLRSWPTAGVLTSQELEKRGYYRQLISKYVAAGWIKKIGHGAFVKLNEKLTWAGALNALQQQLKISAHLGGLSALELHGFAQYVRFNTAENRFDLFNTTNNQQPLPTWFRKSFPNASYIQTHLFSSEEGLVTIEHSGIPIQVSSAERAILEVLSLVPQKFDYNHAFELVENLQLIRPDKMQSLLEKCLSIKAKRLFLYFSDTHQLPSFEKINTSKINLGKGKRVIGRGGKFVSAYQISVPRFTGETEDFDGDINV